MLSFFFVALNIHVTFRFNDFDAVLVLKFLKFINRFFSLSNNIVHIITLLLMIFQRTQ